MIGVPERTIRHLRRYREIAQLLVCRGLGELVDRLELQPYLAFPRRVVRHWREEGSPFSAPQRLRVALEVLGPTFTKLSQVLSMRPDLMPLAYVAELNRLQGAVPCKPWEPIRGRIESELGKPVEERFAHIDREPLAAASLAQVHAATLPSGSDRSLNQWDLADSAGGRSRLGPRTTRSGLQFGAGDRSGYRRGGC